MRASCLLAALLMALAHPGGAETCELSFTIRVTQGVGAIRPGDEMAGRADFTTSRSFRQEAGATAHLATGHLTLGDGISGSVWTLITTSRDISADLVGIYARDVTGLSFAGTDFNGPMALTLYGDAGTRPAPVPPLSQSEWDSLSLRRTLTIHAPDGDMLAGDVTELRADCS
ncbi:MAG: hypothetical protein AAF914_00200 [Pseudomonadota bacterium]